MVRIKVEYDKYNRTFKLLDAQFGSALEDGAQYELFVPLMVESFGPEENVIFMGNTPLAHA
jgi:hypothetical protein